MIVIIIVSHSPPRAQDTLKNPGMFVGRFIKTNTQGGTGLFSAIKEYY